MNDGEPLRTSLGKKRQAARRKRSSHLEHHPISAFLYLKDSMKFHFPSHSCSPFKIFSQYHNEDCSGPMVTGSCLFLGFPNLSVNLCEPVCPLRETVIELKAWVSFPLQTTDPQEKTHSARDVLSVSFPHLVASFSSYLILNANKNTTVASSTPFHCRIDDKTRL